METFRKELSEFIGDKPYAAHICTPFFMISNHTRDDQKVKEIKTLIEELAKDQTYKVPLSWFKMKETLKKYKQSSETEWLTWKEVQDIAGQEGIHDIDRLQAALQFFHNVGDLVYFEDVPEFIVTDPQWLIDMLSKVITIPSHYRRINNKHWKLLEKEALLHKDAMETVWPKGAVQGLTAIMMKYALLLPMPAEYRLRSPDEIPLSGKRYLVPSLLPAKDFDETHLTTDTHVGSAPPVTLVFPNNFIPVGLTSRLITALCNEHDWKTVGQIFKDAATFIVREIKLSVTQKSSQIKVSSNCSGDTSHSGHQGALWTISKTLRKLSPHSNFRVCISCPDCPEHVSTKGPDTTLDVKYTCKNGHTFNSSSYQIWFTLEAPNADVS